MKINEYNQMMKYLTRPAKPEYEQVAMTGPIKGGKKLIEKLIKKGDVKKGEAPKTDVEKVKSKVESDQKNIQELANEGQIPVKSKIPEPFAGKFEEEFTAHNNMFGRRSGDNKVDAQEIAEQVAEARGQDYYDLGYKEQMDLYDKAYNYLGLLDRTKIAMKEAKTSSKLGDLKSPSVPDDDPNMFDDIFNKMYPDYSEGGKYELPLPGEEPLIPIKKKRTLNAEGGRIGFDVGGFGQSKVLRQFLENRIESGNTTFDSLEDLIIQADVNLTDKGVAKVLKEYPNKFFVNVAGTKFPLGLDDKNLNKLKEGITLLEEWKKNPTPENWVKTFQVTEPSGQKKQSKFGQGLRNYLQGKKGEGDLFHKYFKKINFNDTVKKEVKTYDKKLFNKLKSGIGSAAARTSTLETSAAVARTVGETFLRDPEDTNITDIAKALHGKKFDNASDIQKVEMLQDARNGVFKFYQSLTTNRPIGLRKKINGEQFLDIIENIETNSNDFGFQEGQIRDLKMKIRDDILGQKDPAKFFRNLRNNVEVPKGKIIDEVFSLSGTYKRAPGYLDQIQFISNKVNKKKASQIDLPLQNILTALDEGKTVVRYNKKQMPIEKAIQQFNKDSRSFSKINKVKTAQINFGGKFDPSQYKDFSPASQKNIADVFKNKNYFLTTTKTRAPSTILKGVVIPGAESLSKLTESIISDVAKGKIAAPALKALGIAGLGYGIYDTGVGFKEGVSAPELGARFFGLDPVYRYAQEQMSMTPEARQIYRDINREKAFEAEDVAGLGIFDLQPAKEVTEEEKQILETELEKIRQNRELLNQQRAQERADLLNIIQGKIDPNVVAYPSQFSEGGRVGFEKGGSSSDKKKTTPALDKPTVQIDPNAPVDPAKRDTLKGAGILGAGVALGKLGLLKLGKAAKVAKAAKAAKVAPLTKVVAPLGKTMTEFPEWFPTLINKVRKEGTQIPIYKEVEVTLTKPEYDKLSKEGAKVYDRYLGRTDWYKEKLKKEGVPRYYTNKKTNEIIGYEYEIKDLPDVKVTEYGGEELTVSFPNAYGKSVTMEYTPPKGTKDATFKVDDAVPEFGGYPGDAPDFYAETVNNLDEVYGGASRIEQKVLKLKKPRTTQGDEVVARADAQFDVIKDTAEDLDEF